MVLCLFAGRQAPFHPCKDTGRIPKQEPAPSYLVLDDIIELSSPEGTKRPIPAESFLLTSVLGVPLLFFLSLLFATLSLGLPSQADTVTYGVRELGTHAWLLANTLYQAQRIGYALPAPRLCLWQQPDRKNSKDKVIDEIAQPWETGRGVGPFYELDTGDQAFSAPYALH